MNKCVTALRTFNVPLQISGGRIILDFEGLSLSQVTYFSPSFAKMVVDYVQKALPCRLKSIHIVNQPIIFNIVFAMFKPLLQVWLYENILSINQHYESSMTMHSEHRKHFAKPFNISRYALSIYYCTLQEKFRKRIHFHGTDRESLMTFMDKSVLIKRHGGELDVSDTSFSTNLWKLFCSFNSLYQGNCSNTKRRILWWIKKKCRLQLWHKSNILDSKISTIFLYVSAYAKLGYSDKKWSLLDWPSHRW